MWKSQYYFARNSGPSAKDTYRSYSRTLSREPGRYVGSSKIRIRPRGVGSSIGITAFMRHLNVVEANGPGRHMLTVRPNATFNKTKAPSANGQTVGGGSQRVTIAVSGDDFISPTCCSSFRNASRL